MMSRLISDIFSLKIKKKIQNTLLLSGYDVDFGIYLSKRTLNDVK